MLADLAIGDRIVRKADGGRRPQSIREIPVENSRGRALHSVILRAFPPVGNCSGKSLIALE